MLDLVNRLGDEDIRAVYEPLVPRTGIVGNGIVDSS